MYPSKLYLKNFLSYGDPGIEIDFSGYKTLLLIGKNGAGKSSILDAILWALWGKTRGGGDNDIMHSGSSDMEVRLDFVVRNAPYRVVRKRSKKGKGFVSVLELQSLTDPITVLTDATIVQTQNRLEELLGVEYDLLVNSAFLRQGQAQEFSQKSPSKRKQLLGTLLGLEKYAEYHEEAKKNLRKNEVELTQLDRDLVNIQSTLTQYDQELSLQRASLADLDESALETKIAATERTLQDLQLKHHRLEEWDQQLLAATTKATGLSNKVSDMQQKARATEEQIKLLQQTIPDIPATLDQAAWEKVENTFNDYQERFNKHRDLTYRIDSYHNQLANVRQESDKQLRILEEKRQALSIAPDSVLEISTLAAAEADLKNKHQTLLNYAQDIARLEQQMQSIIDQGNQINKRKEAVNTMGEQCPLCEQHIDSTHKHTILDKYTQERESLLATYQDHKVAHDQTLTQKKIVEQAIQGLTISIQKHQSQLQDQEIKKNHLTSITDQIATLQQTTASKIATLEKELSQCKTELLEIGFDQSQWNTLKEERTRLHQAQLQAQKYQEIRSQIQQLEQSRQFITQTQREAESELALTTEQIALLQSKKPQPEDSNTMDNLQDELISLKKQHQYLLQLQALISHRETEQKALVIKLEQTQAQKKTLAQKQEALATLVEALGNKGIPQMLIEESIPRLEQYANEILSHLSDHTMSIRLSLTRPSKTDRDAQIETLDILIGDSVGTRAYELFSGGEAFRIDIALRMALTKLLTEHTHGTIDFLVIDEGFGSQDDTGCDHIIQIIHQLEQYFHLILIITHVDQLKETFPDRLVIKKGPQGSEVFYDDD